MGKLRFPKEKPEITLRLDKAVGLSLIAVGHDPFVIEKLPFPRKRTRDVARLQFHARKINLAVGNGRALINFLIIFADQK